MPLQLTPYHTLTATSTELPAGEATATPLPTVTATPRFHTIEDGQDMYGIAYLYGITVDELMNANPDVNPNAMSVGDQLTIPATTSAEQSDDGTLPSPTPGGVTLGDVSCFQMEDESVLCFVAAQNTLGSAVESISARVRIALETGDVLTETASPLLNLAPNGSVMPLIATFNAVSSFTGANAELVSALPVADESERYLSLRSENQEIEIASNGRSVLVSGEVYLDTGGQASQVWIGAVAFDQEGKITGARRWESPGGLAEGQGLNYELQVYSAGEKITHVSVLLEARP